MKIRKLTGAVGAEIAGIDLAACDAQMAGDVQGALFEHGVIVLRDQSLTPDDHIALAEHWGQIDVNRFFTPVDGFPQIAQVRTTADQKTVVGGTWHTDHSYDPAPAMVSILVARALPPFGGDTCFASQTAAYRHLSDGLKATLEGLSAWHSDGSFATGESFAGIRRDNTGVESLHPVVIRHPQTGQRAIYVNGDFTTHFDGWTQAESAPLLDYLFQYCARPEFMCRIAWAPGSVVIWDNRLVQHFAVADYQGHARLMHRITVEGQPLSA